MVKQHNDIAKIILNLWYWPLYTSNSSHAASLDAFYGGECIYGYYIFKIPLSWAVVGT
jgi:hypothetical protein